MTEAPDWPSLFDARDLAEVFADKLAPGDREEGTMTELPADEDQADEPELDEPELDELPARMVWVPVYDTTGGLLDGMPISTFGIASNHEGVPVPEAGGEIIDTGIAELVALLNRAGVETVQSCHDLGQAGRLVAGFESDDEDAEVVARLYQPDEDTRFGCVVVTWDTFPKVGPMLPGHWVDSQAQNFTNGWLITASPRARFVSIVFPWSDLAEFTASVKAALSPG